MINSHSIKITAFHENFKPQLLIKNIIAYLAGMKRLPSALKCILSILSFYPTCKSGYFPQTTLWYKLRSHFNWCSPYKIYLHFRIRSSYSKETIHNMGPSIYYVNRHIFIPPPPVAPRKFLGSPALCVGTN